MKKFFFCLLLLTAGLLSAGENDFSAFLQELLEQNSDYQQAVNRLEQERAFHKIEKSLQWFDLNFIYRDVDNDIFRDERSNIIETADIAETDRRWRLEMNRTFFPKDFDDEADEINARMRLLRYRQEMFLARMTCLNDIIRDFINWFEAAGKMDIIKQRLQLLYHENLILEELYSETMIDPRTLIDNLEEIEDKEDDYYDNKQICDFFSEKYGDLLSEFHQLYQLWISENAQPDTISFKQNIEKQIAEIGTEKKKIANRLKFGYFHFYLPEIELTLSFNKRQIRQSWDINKNGNLSVIKRKQNEDFLLGEIEFSLPFNVFSNTGGKLALLKAFERELHYRTRNIILDWQKLKVNRLTSLQDYQWEFKRKSRLKELHDLNLQIFRFKFEEEPTLLGDNPQMKLDREILRTKQAALDYEITRMKLYKEIFLINSLREDFE